MALTDRMVSQWEQPVISLEDKPKMMANELKEAFDSNTNQLKQVINGIIDDLTGKDGASNIGLISIEGIDGETVQAVLGSLAAFAKITDEDLAELSSADGASLVGNNIIDGIDGETVSPSKPSFVHRLLNFLKTLPKAVHSQFKRFLMTRCFYPHEVCLHRLQAIPIPMCSVHLNVDRTG